RRPPGRIGGPLRGHHVGDHAALGVGRLRQADVTGEGRDVEAVVVPPARSRRHRYADVAGADALRSHVPADGRRQPFDRQPEIAVAPAFSVDLDLDVFV